MLYIRGSSLFQAKISNLSPFCLVFSFYSTLEILVGDFHFVRTNEPGRRGDIVVIITITCKISTFFLEGAAVLLQGAVFYDIFGVVYKFFDILLLVENVIVHFALFFGNFKKK